MPLGQLILTIGFPALIGTIIIVPAWLIPRFRDNSAVRGAAFGVALGLALVVTFMVEQGLPSMPPMQKWHMLPIIACGIVLLCPVVAMTEGSGLLGQLLIGLVSGGVIASLATFPGIDTLLQIAMGFWVAVSFMILSWVAGHRRGMTLTMTACIVFAAMSVLCQEAGMITVTLIAATLSATSAVAFICSIIAARWTRDAEGKRRYLSIGWGGAFTVASLIPLVAFCGWAYNQGQVEWVHWILVAAAPLMLVLGELPVLASNDRLSGFLIRIGLVAAPVALGLILLAYGPHIYHKSTQPGTADNIELYDYLAPEMP